MNTGMATKKKSSKKPKAKKPAKKKSAAKKATKAGSAKKATKKKPTAKKSAPANKKAAKKAVKKKAVAQKAAPKPPAKKTVESKPSIMATANKSISKPSRNQETKKDIVVLESENIDIMPMESDSEAGDETLPIDGDMKDFNDSGPSDEFDEDDDF